jgi:hypothetical protein
MEHKRKLYNYLLGVIVMLGGPTILYHSSEEGEEIAEVNDQMIRVLPLPQQLTKQGVELAQVKHFQHHVAEVQEWAFEIDLAHDRPDFWIRRGEQRLGLDVAALASTPRRRAADQFRKLKKTLIKAYGRGRLRQCKGIEVQIFFTTERVPTPQQFEGSVGELIEALERYKVDTQTWQRLDRDSFMAGANPYPMGQTGSSANQLMNWHVSGLIRSETLVSISCGFNIEHQYVELASPSKVSADLERIISGHDIVGQGIDELVLVAGGPDIFGEAVAGESMIAELYFGNWKGTISEPACLSRIFVDNWLLGKPRLLFDRSIGYRINA